MKQILLIFSLLFAMKSNAQFGTITNSTSCDFIVHVYCSGPGSCNRLLSTFPFGPTGSITVPASSSVPISVGCLGSGGVTALSYYLLQLVDDQDANCNNEFDDRMIGDLRISLGPENCLTTNHNTTRLRNCGCGFGHSSVLFEYDPLTGNLSIHY